MKNNLKTTKAISEPSIFYKNPKDVLQAVHLSYKQKLKALQNWKQTCIQMDECTSEGMLGKSQSENLELVSEALAKLKKE